MIPPKLNWLLSLVVAKWIFAVWFHAAPPPGPPWQLYFYVVPKVVDGDKGVLVDVPEAVVGLTQGCQIIF